MLLLVALAMAPCHPAWAQASPASPPKKSNTVRITAEQLNQLELAPLELCAFRIEKQAIGQIAFEEASTVVLTSFSGRVTRLISKIGDTVRRGDTLFEIDRCS